MFLGRVIGDLTATIRHEHLHGARLLWVERIEAGGTDDSPTTRPPRPRILALDTVDAGPGDRVLVLDEGNGAAQVLGRGRSAVRTVIVGVVERVWREAS